MTAITCALVWGRLKERRALPLASGAGARRQEVAHGSSTAGGGEDEERAPRPWLPAHGVGGKSQKICGEGIRKKAAWSDWTRGAHARHGGYNASDPPGKYKRFPKKKIPRG